MFSKACEYAIRAMVLIAKESKLGRTVSLTEIAKGIDSPPSFTSKVLQMLVKANLLDSVKGAHGGFRLSPARIVGITLKDIVQCVDGDSVYRGCGLGLKQCSEKNPCPFHDSFKKIRDELKIVLEETTLVHLSERLDSGQSILKRA
ncbi:MAG: RrF2 family transcriptional regulator [Bacteroidia bacterium]